MKCARSSYSGPMGIFAKVTFGLTTAAVKPDPNPRWQQRPVRLLAGRPTEPMLQTRCPDDGGVTEGETYRRAVHS